MRRALRAGGLLVATLLVLETLLRSGVPPTDRARRERAVRAARVLVLGDSFSLDQDGMAVGLLRAELAVRGFGLASLAQPGHGPRNYRESLTAALASHRPDVVLLNYYVGNDISDTMRDRRDVPGWRAAAGEVMRHSHAAALALDAAGAMRQWWQLRGVTMGADAPNALNPFLVDLGRREPDYLAWNLLVAAPEAEAAWQQNRRYITDIADRCRAAGVALHINLLPSTVQVDDSHVPFYRSLGFRVDEWRVAERPQQLLRALCADQGLTCHDWLPALRDAGRELYLEGDDHWNADGHRLAFELMRRELTTLVP